MLSVLRSVPVAVVEELRTVLWNVTLRSSSCNRSGEA